MSVAVVSVLRPTREGTQYKRLRKATNKRIFEEVLKLEMEWLNEKKGNIHETMSTSDDCQVPVRDGQTAMPVQTAPEEMYWLRHMNREELSEKLHTKLRRLISDKKKDDKGGTSSSIKEMEYQEALETQQQAIRDLRLKTQHLEKKLKLANIQLNSAKKNKPMLFRHVGAKVDSGLKQSRAPQVFSQPPFAPSLPKGSPSSNESSGLTSPPIQQREQLMPERIREILEEARERIMVLESERDDLQDQLTDKHQAAENAEYEAHQRIVLLEEEVANLKEELHHREYGRRGAQWQQ
ncbi:hypothetical protein GWK47_000167 [Chionoecetes opilio]|uniref:Uncharacterized protein n=1 Tax=Chionoecetes opilio TaxID=41210 RepID=A0A8J4XRE5_CHIOP|nr:hypothetical protein GWK47_000167 [Chionoecetes opilio]